jgi:hypothetical protein
LSHLSDMDLTVVEELATVPLATTLAAIGGVRACALTSSGDPLDGRAHPLELGAQSRSFFCASRSAVRASSKIPFAHQWARNARTWPLAFDVARRWYFSRAHHAVFRTCRFPRDGQGARNWRALAAAFRSPRRLFLAPTATIVASSRERRCPYLSGIAAGSCCCREDDFDQ